MFVMRALRALPDFFVWWDPRIRERIRPPYAYPGFHTHCLAECVFAGAAIYAAAATAAPRAPQCTIVVNATDPAVNNALASQLSERWKEHGAAYQFASWSDLGKVHDVIDPTTYPAATTLTYPRLIALLESEP
jgi:hypothetical protein